VLQAQGYPAPTVDDPQSLCGSGNCPGSGAAQDLCVSCPHGTYKMLADNSSCVACPNHSSTAQNASFMLAECNCLAGFHSGDGLPFNFSADVVESTVCSDKHSGKGSGSDGGWGWGKGSGSDGGGWGWGRWKHRKVKAKDCERRKTSKKHYKSNGETDGDFWVNSKPNPESKTLNPET